LLWFQAPSRLRLKMALFSSSVGKPLLLPESLPVERDVAS
jgi:hypothetical protein